MTHMTEKEVLRYLTLVDRKLDICLNSGVNWKPEYEDELTSIDKELSQLRILVDAEHTMREAATPMTAPQKMSKLTTRTS